MPFRFCRHILASGLQCQSPALRDQTFCFYHDSYRRRRVPPADRKEIMIPQYDRDGNFSVEKGVEGFATRHPAIDLGTLEDPASVQVAISTVINALAGNRLDMKRATALLYGLQLAAQNCRALPDPLNDLERKQVLREVTTQDGEPIAQPGLLEGEYWSNEFEEEDTAADEDRDEEEQEQENDNLEGEVVDDISAPTVNLARTRTYA